MLWLVKVGKLVRLLVGLNLEYMLIKQQEPFATSIQSEAYDGKRII